MWFSCCEFYSLLWIHSRILWSSFTSAYLESGNIWILLSTSFKDIDWLIDDWVVWLTEVVSARDEGYNSECIFSWRKYLLYFQGIFLLWKWPIFIQTWRRSEMIFQLGCKLKSVFKISPRLSAYCGSHENTGRS